MYTPFTIDPTFHRGPTCTIVELKITDSEGTVHTFSGDSKRNREDRPNMEIGDLYALSRALRSAADAAETSADELVHEESFRWAIAEDATNDLLDVFAKLDFGRRP